MIYLNGSTVIIQACKRFYSHAKETAKERMQIEPGFRRITKTPPARESFDLALFTHLSS